MTGNRPKNSYCFTCGGGYWSLGQESKWVPHKPSCPRDVDNRRRQEREARALRDLEAPFPIDDDRPLGPRVSFDDPDAATFPKERRQSLSEWRRQGGAADYSPSDYTR